MRSVRLIPCLDIDGGRVVKGVNFEDLRDAGDPVELANFYFKEGADELVFLDIAASFEGRSPVIELAAQVAEQVFIPFTVGGGIRTLEDIREALLAGADKVSLNTAAIQNPELVEEAARQFGSQCIVVAIDARRRGAPVVEEEPVAPPDEIEPQIPPVAVMEAHARGEVLLGLESLGGLVGIEQPPIGQEPSLDTVQLKGFDEDVSWEVYTHGGRYPTGLDAIDWARRVADLGAGEILLTSMDGDGTLVGYDLALTRAVGEAVPIPVIASGGAGRPEHLVQAVTEGKADAVLIASILHDGVYRICDLKKQMADAGVPVRLVRSES